MQVRKIAVSAVMMGALTAGGLGLAAAPIFPLFTLTTGQRLGSADDAGTTRAVSLQVAVSAIGSAALSAGIGLVVATVDATAIAVPLLLFSLTMCAVYALMSRSSAAPLRSL